jgi:hypothetical protein
MSLRPLRPRLDRRSRLVLLGVAAALGMPSAAGAATWSEPVPAGEPAREANPRTLGFDALGRALLTWRGDRAAGPDDPSVFFVGVATRAPGQTAWARRASLTGRLVFHDLAHYGRTRVLLGGTRQDPEGTRSRSRLVVSFGRSTGDFGRLRVLARGPALPVTFEGASPSIWDVGMSANPAGDATLVWTQTAPAEQRGIRVSLRRSRGGFSAPRTLRRQGGQPVAVMNDRGDRLVAWRRGNRIEARRRAAGRDWGPVERLGESGTAASLRLDATLTSTGKATVAWSDFAHSAEGIFVLHRVAARTPRSGWRTSRIEDGFRYAGAPDTFHVSFSVIRALSDRRGRPWVVWPSMVDGTVRVKAAPVIGAPERLRLDTPTVISEPGHHVALADAAAGPAGQLAVTWTQNPPPGGATVLTAVRPHGGPWGPPEVVTQAPVSAHREALVAFDPRAGQPLAAFALETRTPERSVVTPHAAERRP